MAEIEGSYLRILMTTSASIMSVTISRRTSRLGFFFCLTLDHVSQLQNKCRIVADGLSGVHVWRTFLSGLELVVSRSECRV